MEKGKSAEENQVSKTSSSVRVSGLSNLALPPPSPHPPCFKMIFSFGMLNFLAASSNASSSDRPLQTAHSSKIKSMNEGEGRRGKGEEGEERRGRGRREREREEGKGGEGGGEGRGRRGREREEGKGRAVEGKGKRDLPHPVVSIIRLRR